MNVFGHQCHLFDNLLLKKEFAESCLKFSAAFGKMSAQLVACLLRRTPPFGVSVIGRLVQFANDFDQSHKSAKIFFAAFDFVENNAVKPLSRRISQQLFSQGNMFLGGEPNAINDLLELIFGRFNPFGNFNFLFASKQRNLAHLLQIHANRIIEDVEPAFIVHFLRFRLLDAIHFSLIDYFHFKAPQLDANLVQILRADQIVRKRFVDVSVSEVTLFLRQQHQFFKLRGDFHLVMDGRGARGQRL